MYFKSGGWENGQPFIQFVYQSAFFIVEKTIHSRIKENGYL